MRSSRAAVRRVARGDLYACPDAQERGPLEVVAGAALEGEASLP